MSTGYLWSYYQRYWQAKEKSGPRPLMWTLSVSDQESDIAFTFAWCGYPFINPYSPSRRPSLSLLLGLGIPLHVSADTWRCCTDSQKSESGEEWNTVTMNVIGVSMCPCPQFVNWLTFGGGDGLAQWRSGWGTVLLVAKIITMHCSSVKRHTHAYSTYLRVQLSLVHTYRHRIN